MRNNVDISRDLNLDVGPRAVERRRTTFAALPWHDLELWVFDWNLPSWALLGTQVYELNNDNLTSLEH